MNVSAARKRPFILRVGAVVIPAKGGNLLFALRVVLVNQNDSLLSQCEIHEIWSPYQDSVTHTQKVIIANPRICSSP